MLLVRTEGGFREVYEISQDLEDKALAFGFTQAHHPESPQCLERTIFKMFVARLGFILRWEDLITKGV